jgi:hypothetical protein
MLGQATTDEATLSTGRAAFASDRAIDVLVTFPTGRLAAGVLTGSHLGIQSQNAEATNGERNGRESHYSRDLQ